MTFCKASYRASIRLSEHKHVAVRTWKEYQGGREKRFSKFDSCRGRCLLGHVHIFNSMITSLCETLKGAGPGIWEELFGYIGLGYRVLPANAIRQLAQLWTYSTMSGRGGMYLQRVGGPRRARTSTRRRKNSVAEVLCILPPTPREGCNQMNSHPKANQR
jgi:hypothetical protein